MRSRHVKGGLAHGAFLLSALVGIVVLGVLLYDIVRDGWPWLTWDFLENFPSRFPARAGIKSALYGTAWSIVLTALVAVPLGIGAAVYLEEFTKPNLIRRVIDINIANLAGVPSIVYGILGLAIFVRFFMLGRSLLAGALTMALLILPAIIITTRESLKAVPDSLRMAALALGATKVQTVWAQILPQAMPGIMTGIILALSRAIGETAPLIMIGALSFVAFIPSGPMDSFTVLPIQIFNWASRPQDEFHQIAAAAIIVLLAILLLSNGIALYVRQKLQRRRQ